MDDQPTPCHGHRGDGVANIRRHAALEVELLVLQAPEQAPELAGREAPGNVTESWDGIHGEKISKSFPKNCQNGIYLSKIAESFVK